MLKQTLSWVFPLVFLATKRGLLSQIASRCFQSCSAIVGNSLYSLSKSDLFAFHLLQPCHCIKPNKFPVQNSFSGYRRALRRIRTHGGTDLPRNGANVLVRGLNTLSPQHHHRSVEVIANSLLPLWNRA